MTTQRLARTVLSVVGLLAALVLPANALAKNAGSGPTVQAGAAALDGTYHVGNSAGQYASTRDGGYGDVDPHAEQVKNMASYGVQSRESVRALVVKGTDGNLVALVSDDHYIPQDALWRRTAQILDQKTGGLINMKNLTMSVTHNHSSPSYSSLDWGVWSFQDAFDFRFFDYYANQNANAVLQALDKLQPVRVSATVVKYDAVQKNPMGPGWADDGTPDGFPRPHTDHDLSVVLFQNSQTHNNIATLFNWGQHPEDLEGYDLISGEYPAEAERFVDRSVGGVSIFTQNATGTSEVEEDRWHPIHDRELVDHAQYNQMEWAARQLATAAIAAVKSIEAQKPNPDDDPTPYGGTSYHDRFVKWMSKFPVAMDDRWFGGPVSHPYPGVSSCRTDAALQGDPRLPVAGLPDCEEVPAGSSLSPVISQAGLAFPGISTDTFEALGIPIPENYSAPSHGALEDTYGVHMQAFRLGDILFTVCSCEQWVEQSYNIKTRTDEQPGNEYLGYDPTSSKADPTEKCVRKDSGSWACTVSDNPDYDPQHPPAPTTVPDSKIKHMQAQILNDAAGWDDPDCNEIGCGYQAESESTDLSKVRGNFTHDDTTVHGGTNQTKDYAQDRGYKLTFTIGMANDYNGYIASYREYMDHDHYRKALTGWGPHSSDYYATRLVQMGHELSGDKQAQQDLDEQTVLDKASDGWRPMVVKEVADQAAESAKVQAVGEAAAAGVQAYALTLPDDGGQDQALTQPKNIERFDAATFTWDGGNNYTDNPYVTVERQVDGQWKTFADQSGEVPITLAYPGGKAEWDENAPADIATGMIGYRAQPQEWKWTASFEAFVSRFPLVDPQGNEYTSTPTGTYRFVVHGKWRKGNADADYTRISNPFTVKPWSGITVENAAKDSAGHVTFDAGPTHNVNEHEARRSARPSYYLTRSDPTVPWNDTPYPFTIGPVDYPDTAKDMAATGARFLSAQRGYSGSCLAWTRSPVLQHCDKPGEYEHYCLDCSFRPWLDVTDDLTATVTIRRATGATSQEKVKPDARGHFVTASTLKPGDTASITIQDAWGDNSASAGSV